jgi:hypothetical protein
VSALRSIITSAGIARERWGFLWRRRLWGLIALVSCILPFGTPLIFAQRSGIAPFISTLF